MKLTINERIAKLREWMHSESIQAAIIPSADPHMSEYLPDYWKTREWLSGFTGSAGTVVVGIDTAGLWTDSRYFIQAESELKGTVIQLHKMGEKGVLSIPDWLCKTLFSGDRIYVDASCITLAEFRKYRDKLKGSALEVIAGDDVFRHIWEDRPPLPAHPVFEHPREFCGKPMGEKLSEIRREMKQQSASHLLVTALDEIAWTLNLRGSDVECNPVFLAWLVIDEEKATLFSDNSKFSAKIIGQLEENGIEIRPYRHIEDFIAGLTENTRLMIDPLQVNYRISVAANKTNLIEKSSPVCQLKASKTHEEIDHIKEAMRRDGVAVFRAFEWLKQQLKSGTVPEYVLAEKLAFFRSQQSNYMGESFHAIVGYRGNGAIVHYRATESHFSEIEKEGMLLVDSGGQYLDGTTDITRTIHLSEPNDRERQHFTLVLKGMIALSRAVFPEGTHGVQLDILARQPLWNHGLNYGHGTGHGVGYFLNVHEPPQGFVPNLSQRGTSVLREGMITSNEPGYYLEGHYGIRCENLVVCRDRGDGFQFLETLTLMAFDQKLINPDLLSPEEKTWLNEYHQSVYRELSSLLTESERLILKEQC
ncbi:MAG: aminopeptidase P family protein, partial [Saprospirales bacterium]